MTWWSDMIEWLPWHHQKLPVSELNAALDANAAAHEGVAKDEAELSSRLAEQRVKTEVMRHEIRGRTERLQAPSPALIAIRDTLKSLEKPS